MSPHDHVLGRLCTTLETRRNAERLYVQAAQLTRPGSGHALGAGQAALPAVCAFLASERLGNGEVAQDQARAATSVNEKTFRTTLAVVERILPGSAAATPTPAGVGPARATYATLMRRHGVRADGIVPMKEVEAALRASGALAHCRLSATSELVRCAVFHWVCTRILAGVPVAEARAFRRECGLGRAPWAAVHALLERHCAHMVAGLARNAETAARAAAARVTRSQARRTPPGGGGLRPAPVQVRRRASPAAHESPATRRKDGPCAPSGTHTPHAGRGNAAPALSGRTVSDNAGICLDEDEAEEVPAGTIVVTSAGRGAAWDAQRPTGKGRPVSTGSPPFTPPKHVPFINSTPMTSTGMSVGASRELPSGVPGSRSRSLKQICPPAETCALEDEEMPRWRRRKLRAPFLDGGAYGWNPSARAKQLLERARRWEALMVDKYGDPWDDL